MDPAGQFASPYTGMGNNPVMMVDPTGEIAFLAVAAIVAKGALIGAGVSGAAYGISTTASGNAWNWRDFGSALGSGAIAGGSAALLGPVAGGMLSGGINAGINGGDIGQGVVMGGIGGAVGAGFSDLANVNGIIPGAVYGAATRGLTSGGLSALQGGDFWAGFEQGAIAGGIGGGLSGYQNARANGRSAAFGHITEKSATRYASSLGVDLTPEELNHIIANRKGLDLDSYFNDLPDTEIIPYGLRPVEVVDDNGYGWWDYYEAEVAAYKAYMRSGAITPVYPESYLIGGYGAARSGIKVFTNASRRGITLMKTGKNFRIDVDWKNGLHYHRRGPGGIGRHRPWQVKPGDKGNFWKRF